jgi:hypothetical protein
MLRMYAIGSLFYGRHSNVSPSWSLSTIRRGPFQSVQGCALSPIRIPEAPCRSVPSPLLSLNARFSSRTGPPRLDSQSRPAICHPAASLSGHIPLIRSNSCALSEHMNLYTETKSKRKKGYRRLCRGSGEQEEPIALKVVVR